MSNKLLATLLLVLTFVGLATAGIISRPTKTTGGTSFTDGTIPHDSDLNGDADTIYTLVNGNIEDANIKAGAAISASKITPNFAANVQVSTAAAPCFVNINSALGADLKQWRICQNGSGVLSIATYTDAGAVIITPLSIARATGIITTSGGLVVGNGLTVSAGGIAVTGGIQTSDLTAKSFLFSGTAGLFTTTAAPTNGQMLIGSTGNNPAVGTITGTATHICTTLGSGTFALDFCANPALASPVFSGTITGTYTIGGTPTLIDNVFTISGSGDATKQIAFEVDGITSATKRTITIPDRDLTIGPALQTEQATTSGGSIGFTSIPAGTKRITMMFTGVSLAGTSSFAVQIGSGSYASSGYVSTNSTNSNGASPVVTNGTTGFLVYSGASAAETIDGQIILNLADSVNNRWVATSNVALTTTKFQLMAGTKALSGALDRIQITSASSFDAGVVNISYE